MGGGVQSLRLSLGRGTQVPRTQASSRKTHRTLSTPPSSIYLSAHPQEVTAQVGSDHLPTPQAHRKSTARA